jgi:hypothetical protein
VSGGITYDALGRYPAGPTVGGEGGFFMYKQVLDPVGNSLGVPAVSDAFAGVLSIPLPGFEAAL